MARNAIFQKKKPIAVGVQQALSLCGDVVGSLSPWSKTVLYGINSEKKTLKKNFFLKKRDVFSKIKSEILVEIWAEIFSKKKLFFLAMFKNEITTFKNFFFEKFRFFFAKNFQKIGHKILLGPVFSMIFFFSPASFLRRISR